MTHKSISFTAVVLCLLIAIIVGCKQKTPEEQAAKEQPVQTPATTEQAKPTKALTDDDFIEYWAQMTYIQGYLVAEKHAKDPVKATQVMTEEFKKLEKRFGMTSEELGNSYAAWMGEWTKKASSEPEKYLKQWEEISKRIEKRVAELKKGN